MRIEEIIELGISFGAALNYRVNAGNPVCFGYPVFIQGILLYYPALSQRINYFPFNGH
jgi:hypothetical protein